MRALLPWIIVLAGCARDHQTVAVVSDAAIGRDASVHDAAHADAAEPSAPEGAFYSEPASTIAHLEAIWGDGQDAFYAVGTGGTLLSYGPGAGWQAQDVSTENLAAVWGRGPHEIYLGGDGGIVLRRNAEATIETLPAAGDATITGIWGTATGSALWVTNDGDGVVRRFDGAAWNDENAASSPLQAIWGTSESNIFAVGGERVLGPSRVVRYDGTSWEPMTPPNAAQLSGVWASGPSFVLAVGELSIFMYYDGAAWGGETLEGAFTLYAVHALSPDDVWIAGANGTIFHYNGTASRRIPTNTSMPLMGIWANGPADVVAVGMGGTVLRYRP